MQFSNIWPIPSLTWDVLKLDKSKEVKLKQSLNILDILVTPEVLKLDKSNVFNELHPSNIAYILLHLDVLKLVKFISTIEGQFLNKHRHSVKSSSHTNLTMFSGYK